MFQDNGAPLLLITLVQRLPFTLRAPVELKLRQLHTADIIEPLKAFSCISTIVFAAKRDNSIRLCLDYHWLEVCTTHFPIPLVDKLFSKVGHLSVFITLMIWQLHLWPSSAFHNDFFNLTTMLSSALIIFLFGSSETDHSQCPKALKLTL